MSTTIYVVTSGCYSDYRIQGVFSTRELAEKLAAHHKSNSGDVEEYVLDKKSLPEGMFKYQVVFDREGNTRVYQQAPSEEERTMPYGYTLEGFKKDDTMQTHCWATDEAHAAKIANERRVQIIAEGRWESNWENWKGRGLNELP